MIGEMSMPMPLRGIHLRDGRQDRLRGPVEKGYDWVIRIGIDQEMSARPMNDPHIGWSVRYQLF